jgi:hypothetical protein
MKPLYTSVFAVLLAATMLSMGPGRANAAVSLATTSIVGTVKNASGQPVGQVQISVIDKVTHKVIARAITNPDGTYKITGITPNRVYVIHLDPLATGFKAGDAVAFVGPEGLTSDWDVSSMAEAVDQATVGTGGTAGGVSSLGAAGIGLGTEGLVLGGTLGGIAASGGFSSPSASPSL